MINTKKGSTAIVNLISVIVSVIIIIAIGVIYYMFFSPSELILEEVEYSKIDIKYYEIDKDFERGLDTTIDFNYTDDDLDMHEDLKDYYQGREDPFSNSDDRNTTIELDPQIPKEDKITNSRPDLVIPEIDETEESDIDINSSSSSIIGF